MIKTQTTPSQNFSKRPQPVLGLKAQRSIRTVVEWITALVLGFIMMFPVIWTIKSCFQPQKDLLASPAIWIPRSLYLENFRTVMADATIWSSLWNSLIISGGSTLISVAVGVLASYAFVRFKYKGKNAMFVGVLITQMLPGIVLVIPLYIIMERLGVLYSYPALVLVYVSFTLPYSIWLQRAFLANAPWELEDQARIDGCNRMGAFLRVIIPTILPGLVTTSIFAFINSWNEFLFALVLTDPHTKTFPVRLSEYISQERIALELMFPAGLLATIPGVIFILLFGRYIISGLGAGALKG